MGCGFATSVQTFSMTRYLIYLVLQFMLLVLLVVNQSSLIQYLLMIIVFNFDIINLSRDLFIVRFF